MKISAMKPVAVASLLTLVITTMVAVESKRAARNVASANLGTDCSTMAAITVDKIGSKFLLQADVPQWAINDTVEFQVRLAPAGEKWKTCQQDTNCNGAVLPMLTRTELPDGSIHYSGYVSMSTGTISGNGQKYAMGTTTFVRLVTRYQMLGMCQAQVSVAVPQGGSYALSIHIPAGLTVQTISTYWRPLDWDRVP
jgi:hypothetical protein